MKIRSSIKKDTIRLLTKEDKQYGILNYGEDNAYPQRIFDLINSSSTTKSCAGTYGRFIQGRGFKDLVFYRSIINGKRQTMDKILRLIADDLKRYRGFALHLNVSANGKYIEIYHVPFEFVRLASDDKKNETGYSYAVYPDWDKCVKSSVNKSGIIWLHSTTTDIAEINKQAEEAGGWDTYKGQLLYVSLDEGGYPLASCDAILENVYAEIQSDITTTNNIQENFTAKGMIVHKGKFASDEEKEEFEDDVEEFIGPEGASIIVVDVDKDEDKPEFVKIDSTANDKMFEYTDRKVRDKIINNYLLPKILLSVTEGGGFFNQEQVRDAVEYYNLVTDSERLTVEEVFKFIGSNFAYQINPSGDYSIIPIEFKITKKEIPSGVLDYLKLSMSPAAKRQGLIMFLGVDPEDAKLLVPDEAAAPAEPANPNPAI